MFPGHGKGRDVFPNGGAAADNTMGADAGELMDPRHSADDGVVFHMDMAGQVGGIGHDDPVAELAVVGDVTIGHDEIAIPHDRDADISGGGTMDGNEFTDRVVIADDRPRNLVAELEVLGYGADGGKLKDPASRADVGMFVDDDMRSDDGILADIDIRGNDGVRTDYDPFLQIRRPGDDSGGMNVHKSVVSPSFLLIICSSAATRLFSAAILFLISGNLGIEEAARSHSR